MNNLLSQDDRDFLERTLYRAAVLMGHVAHYGKKGYSSVLLNEADEFLHESKLRNEELTEEENK